MVSFGYAASLEEFSPAESLEQAVLAEEAGFDAVWVNDHFHPWFDELADGSKAHGGNCWSWLPAALERTDDVRVGTGVTAVLNRYHPANVAHRLATLLELYPDRVLFGIGTGEALNEAPLGEPWPPFDERARRTAEAIRLIRRLFREEFVTFEGEFWSVEDANLYTGPDEPPPVYVASDGLTAARMAGDLGDGYLTIFDDPDAVESERFAAVRRGVERSDRNESFDDLDVVGYVHCSYAESEAAALEQCKPWRLVFLPVFFDRNVADPRYMQEHGRLVSTDVVEDAFVVTADAEDLRDVAAEMVETGFDHLVFQSSSPDQRRFFEAMGETVIPAFD